MITIKKVNMEKLSSYNKNWITLSLDSIKKEKPKHCQQGKVKQKVSNIENLEKQFDANYIKKQNIQKHEIDMSNIINYLFDVQTHLRCDLSYINWPSMIIGKTTQTSIAYTNVNIKLDEWDWNLLSFTLSYTVVILIHIFKTK